MNPDDLARILDELGQRLGPTGEYVFALAVRQIVIESVMTIATSLLALLVGTVLWRPARRRLQREIADGQFPAMPTLGFFCIAGLVALIAFGVGSLLLGSAVPSLLNPEYAAIRDILSAIHP